jgi:NADH-quinone oxidoreductase subunit E
MPFSESLLNRINEIIAISETKQSALIPVLREVQNELGWLSEESMLEVAAILDIPPSQVQSVATFYGCAEPSPVPFAGQSMLSTTSQRSSV